MSSSSSTQQESDLEVIPLKDESQPSQAKNSNSLSTNVPKIQLDSINQDVSYSESIFWGGGYFFYAISF